MMKKDVWVEVTGIGEDSASSTAIPMPGEYHFRGGRHYVIYEETAKESVSKVMLNVSDRDVRVLRTGESRTELCFEEGKVHPARIQTPFGSLEMEAETGSLQVGFAEERITVEVNYDLSIRGEKADRRRLVIQVTPRHTVTYKV